MKYIIHALRARRGKSGMEILKKTAVCIGCIAFILTALWMIIGLADAVLSGGNYQPWNFWHVMIKMAGR